MQVISVRDAIYLEKDLMAVTSTGRTALCISVALHILALAGLMRWPISQPRTPDGEPCDFSFVSLETPPEPEPFVASMTTGIFEISEPEHVTDTLGKVPQVDSAPTELPKPPGLGERQSSPPAGSRPENGTGESGASRVSATFFQIPCRGQTILYVIDASSSMGPNGGLEAASRELLTSIRRLGPQVRFQVMAFNSHANFLVPALPNWLAPSADVIDRVGLALLDLQAEGRTDYRLALQKALSMRPDVLYFLTDANDLPPRLVEEITRLNAGRSAIHVIELTGRRDPPLDSDLQFLARENRGLFRRCMP